MIGPVLIGMGIGPFITFALFGDNTLLILSLLYLMASLLYKRK